MGNSILYYPTIEFRNSDYKWLWTASLFWDKIYRIVPENFILNEPENIKKLCSGGDIGIQISPNPYSKDSSDKFLRNIKNKEWDIATFPFNRLDEEAEFSLISNSKMDMKLKTYLIENSFGKSSEEWTQVSKDMSNAYMSYLANEIASRNDLSLVTHSEMFWKASTYFSHEGSLQGGLICSDANYGCAGQDALLNIIIKDIIPENIMLITPEELLEFRERRSDERKEFILAIENFSDKLSKITDKNIIEDLINDEKKEIERATTEYKNSMDLLNVEKWVGGLSSTATVLAEVIPETGILGNILPGLAVAQLLITGYIGVKGRNVKKTPYSYLTSIYNKTPVTIGNYNYLSY